MDERPYAIKKRVEKMGIMAARRKKKIEEKMAKSFINCRCRI